MASANEGAEKILLVSYLFPPAGGVAVQRILSLARYLPQQGHEVYVLSCRNPGVPNMDPSLLRHVPPQVEVCRTWSPEPPYAFRQKIWSLFSRGKSSSPPQISQAPKTSPKKAGWRSSIRDALRTIFFPDPEVVWARFARRHARRIVRRHGIGAVLITAPPFSALLIGTALKREFPVLKFIADFRDDWVGYYLQEYDFYKSEAMRRRTLEMERQIVESASLVVSVTRTITADIRSRYPEQPDAKFHHISNGYDPASFADFHPRQHGTSRIVVTYAGTSHKSSSARYYLDALDALPEEQRSQFESRFIGRIPADEARFFQGRKSCIQRLGFLPQSKVLQHLEETDFLLLTMMHAGSLTGKVFEYLATGKPILAVAPHDSEVARLIKETGSGWCADPAYPEEMQALLERAISHRNSGGAGYAPDQKAVRRYDRSEQAREYSRLIRQAE